ncbi:MAG: hypothetical protein Q4C87_11425 [Actinomycetaceae bacterium]|nr:hypothetical protein [Actinomycetaceae bacterium]
MHKEFFAGMFASFKYWRAIISVTLIFTLVYFIISILLTDVLIQWNSLEGGRALRSEQATVFTPYYPHNKVTPIRDHTRRKISDLISSEQAYTSIFTNVEVNSHRLANEMPIIIIIGTRASSLFPDLDICDNPPCATLGSLTTSDISNVELYGLEIPITGHHKENTTWFDPSSAAKNLDSHLLVHLRSEDLSILDPYALEEAFTRAVFIDVPPREFDAFLSQTAEDGLHLVPSDVSIEQPAKFKNLMTAAGMYLIAIAAFSVLMALAFFESCRLVAKKELPSLAIRKLCGATSMMLVSRLSGFISSIMLIIPSIMSLLLQFLGSPFQETGQFALLSTIICYALAVCTLVGQLFRNETHLL